MIGDTTLTFNGGTVHLKRTGQSEQIIAQVLGHESKDGVRTIYLDRLIHEHYERTLDVFNVTGAISTILTIAENFAPPIGP